MAIPTLKDALSTYPADDPTYERLFAKSGGLHLNHTESNGWTLSSNPKDLNLSKVISQLMQEQNFSEQVEKPKFFAKRLNTLLTKRVTHEVEEGREVVFKSTHPRNSFLSNLFPTLLHFKYGTHYDQLFPSVEAAYQLIQATYLSQQSSETQPDLAQRYNALTLNILANIENPSEILKQSSRVKKLIEQDSTLNPANEPFLRSWKQVRVDCMRHLIKAKFKQNPTLQEALLSTAPYSLREGTSNQFWGGETNTLGKELQALRDNPENWTSPSKAGGASGTAALAE